MSLIYRTLIAFMTAFLIVLLAPNVAISQDSACVEAGFVQEIFRRSEACPGKKDVVTCSPHGIRANVEPKSM